MANVVHFQVQNEQKVIKQLKELDAKVQRKVVKKATNAAGKPVLKAALQGFRAIKQTGFTARSLKSVSKSRKGETTVRVGQQKQRTFKARKSNRVKGRNFSQIQRAGKPVPIHWLERGTKAHIIKAKPGKRLVFGGRGRRTRNNRNLIFATQVRNPGMRGRNVLQTAGRQSAQAAGREFENVVRQELSKV